MAGRMDEVQLSSFLSIMAVRGIYTEELHGLADAMQSGAEPISLPSGVVDIVGTDCATSGIVSTSQVTITMAVITYRSFLSVSNTTRTAN